MITLPIKDLEGLLSSLEALFGPQISQPVNSEITDSRLVEINKYASSLKSILNKHKSEEKVAKAIYQACENQLDDDDKNYLQELIEEIYSYTDYDSNYDSTRTTAESQMLFLVKALGEKEVCRLFNETFEGRLNV